MLKRTAITVLAVAFTCFWVYVLVTYQNIKTMDSCDKEIDFSNRFRLAKSEIDVRNISLDEVNCMAQELPLPAKFFFNREHMISSIVVQKK